MIQNKINYSYDKEIDSLFLYICQDYTYEETIELNANILLDFESNGLPVAVELLSASHLFNIEKDYFDNISNLKVNININDKIIDLTVLLTAIIQKQTIYGSIKEIGINNLSIPDSSCELAIVL